MTMCRTWPPGIVWVALSLRLPSSGLSGQPLGAAPRAHPVKRYQVLWAEPWFHGGESMDEVREQALPASVFPFKLTGVAEWRGKAYIYLLDERNLAYELSVGEPRGDLELLSVHFGDAGSSHKAEVRYRTDYFDLEFDLNQHFVATPSAASEPGVQATVNVRVNPRRPQTRSPIKRNLDSRTKRTRGDREARDWFEGWFRD